MADKQLAFWGPARVYAQDRRLLDHLYELCGINIQKKRVPSCEPPKDGVRHIETQNIIYSESCNLNIQLGSQQMPKSELSTHIKNIPGLYAA